METSRRDRRNMTIRDRLKSDCTVSVCQLDSLDSTLLRRTKFIQVIGINLTFLLDSGDVVPSFSFPHFSSA